ncbi:hypothetical protein Y59_35330 [Enterobacter hormaechei]|nr:hypothetical protein Y59_35330 [Enterobacter hormaechei]
MLADLGRSKESNGKYCFIHSIFAGSALIPSENMATSDTP